MTAQDYQIGQLNERTTKVGRATGWHLGTVIIPRRSISGKLVSGQVWRRRQGTRWVYKKFVEYADRDVTGIQSGQELMRNLIIKATILLSAVVGSTASLFAISWLGLALLGF
jgi:hypothetical protein